jgi:hypothetical protein
MINFEKLDGQRNESIKFLPKKWANFFSKFKEIEGLKNSKWKPVHHLAYIDKRFREIYNKNFAYTFRGAPSKCPEIYLVKKIYAMLATTNAITIREYIDWVFDYKIIPSNRKIRTLGFFSLDGFGNEFYIYKKEKDSIKRDTELPENYKLAIEELGLPVYTYGDLAFARSALEESSNGESRKPYVVMFDKLYALGFEDDVLKDIK